MRVTIKIYIDINTTYINFRPTMYLEIYAYSSKYNIYRDKFNIYNI